MTDRCLLRSKTAARGLALLIVLTMLAGTAASAGSAEAGPPTIVRSSVATRNSRCDHPPLDALSYHYPIKPFARQHSIRGFFGDPRTVTTTTFGEDRPGSLGSFTFHNGVDISAATGTPVYPVVSGFARIASGDKVIVVTEDFRTFQYFHIKPAIRAGDRVTAYHTVLGTVLPEWRHVHLSEIDGFRVHNPLDPGHLEPYRDHKTPQVDELLFSTEHGSSLDPQKLQGKISIAANASDIPPIPVPGIWYDFPVTPAFVAWRMVSRAGTVVPETTVADFRFTEPPDRDFWRVYAAGTYQNFPVFDHDYYFHHPGRYLFNLTPAPLDTRMLANGSYGITVDVADVCGNLGSLSERVEVAN